MSYEDEVSAIENELGWTLDDASNCMCNISPAGPCENCWSLGWRIGGIEEQRSAERQEIRRAELAEEMRNDAFGGVHD